MAALRAGLGDGLLSGLDFRVGGGVMYYSRQRPALPADLAGLSPSKLDLPDNEAAQVCVALVLLARGELDRSHDIVGNLGSQEATWAHAMIHRREGAAQGEAGLPGYANARYWFSCTGDHPVYAQLQAFASKHPDSPPALAAKEEWQPAQFVALCERSGDGGAAAGFCRAVQQHEWELLFDHCAELAAG